MRVFACALLALAWAQPPPYASLLAGDASLPLSTCVSTIGGTPPKAETTSASTITMWPDKVGVLPGTNIPIFPGGVGLTSALLAATPSGTPYVIAGGSVNVVDASASATSMAIGTHGSGFTTAPDGSVYMASGVALLRYVPANGSISLIAGKLAVNGAWGGQDPTFNASTGSWCGDGGPAIYAVTSAWMSRPAATPDNFLYFGDIYYHYIRVIDLSTPALVVTFVAGTPTRKGNADGAATAASFNYPWDVAYFNGILYVADTWNEAIRAVAVGTRARPGSRAVTRFAGASRGFAVDATGGLFGGDGGPAAQAYLSCPRGVATSPVTGDVFIADSCNNAVRRVSASTGVITTVAGVGDGDTPGYAGDGGPATAARLREPWGVHVQDDGHLLIADSSNNAIRRVDMTTRIITTVVAQASAASSSSAGRSVTTLPAPAVNFTFKSIKGIAIAPDGASIIIADSGYSALLRLTPATGMLTLVAGTPMVSGTAGDGGPATAALLKGPCRPIFAPNGDILFPDTTSHAVRRVSAATGMISTAVGTLGTSGYRASDEGRAPTTVLLNSPVDIALSALGHLFVSDINNNCIRVVNGSTQLFHTYAGQCATFIAYGGVSNGAFCFAIPPGAAAATALMQPQFLAIDQTGSLWFKDAFPSLFYRIDSVTRQVWPVGSMPSSAINATTGVCQSAYPGFASPGDAAWNATNLAGGFVFSPGGDLFIATNNNNQNSPTLWAVRSGKIVPFVGTWGAWGYADAPDALTGLINGPQLIAYHPTVGIVFDDYGGSLLRHAPLAAPTVCPAGFACSCGYNPKPCTPLGAAFCPANSSAPLLANPGFQTVFAPAWGGTLAAVSQKPCRLALFVRRASPTSAFRAATACSQASRSPTPAPPARRAPTCRPPVSGPPAAAPAPVCRALQAPLPQRRDRRFVRAARPARLRRRRQRRAPPPPRAFRARPAARRSAARALASPRRK